MSSTTVVEAFWEREVQNIMAVYASAAIWNNLKEISDRHEGSGIADQRNVRLRD